MVISLSHIGEAIFAKIAKQKPVEFLRWCELEEVADLDSGHRHGLFVEPEASLCPFAGCGFDGASKVDVAVQVREDLAVAFELKLGETRLSAGRVNNEWLKPCERSRHGDGRWKGSMMAILDRNFPRVQPEEELRVELRKEPIALHEDWFVVVRRRVKETWVTDCPQFRRAKVLAFEGLVDAFGGREPFNDLVRDLVACNDYYAEWKLGS